MARMSEFTFLSSDGQTALSAREYLPEGDSAGIVQIVHGIAEPGMTPSPRFSPSTALSL